MLVAQVDQQEQSKRWQKTKALLRERVDEMDFEHWIAKVSFLERENGTVKLGAPYGVIVDRVTKDFNGVIGQALWDAFGENVGFELVVDEFLATLPEEITFNRHSPQRQVHPARTGEIKPVATRFFVPDPNNSLAREALRDFLGDGPLSRRGVICIYGDNGMGKTHLLETVVSWYRKKNLTKQVFVEDSDRFKHAHFVSCSDNTGMLFYRRRAECDLWVVDDLHMLETKKEDAECHKKFLAIWNWPPT